MSKLELRREQILGHRRRANALERRLPRDRASLERAAQVGLQDSAPRAALLSIHARVEGATPTAWEDPAYVQIWGPRFSVYVVAEKDRALFTVSRLFDNPRDLHFARDLADRLHAYLRGRRLPYDDVAQALGLPNHNVLRYVAPTGTLLMRWEGARTPLVWSVPAPDLEPLQARQAIARRYLHVFGPSTAAGFAKWAGIGRSQAAHAIEVLAPELLATRGPVADGWILAADEESFRSDHPSPSDGVRLLPSGDAYWLLWGADRDLLVPDPAGRDRLWTPRVWPGALLLSGEVAGTWRRAGSILDVETWRRLSPTDRHAVEAEAAALPLPGLGRPVSVRWMRG